MKSIQFPSGNYHYKIPNAVFYEIFKHKNILFIFDKVSGKNHMESTSFEDYVIEQDLQEFKRYKRMKEEFKKWCEDNPGYGY